MIGDLTTLEHVKQWLAIEADNTSSDAILRRLITAASRFIVNYTNRGGFNARPYVETYNGYGQTFMVLRQWPLIALNSLTFGGSVLTSQAQGNPPANGFNAAPTETGPATVVLFGYCFPQGRNAVAVSYNAGYQTVEPAVITLTDAVYTVELLSTWIGPGLPVAPATSAVVNANTGAAFTLVTGAPGVGQYKLSLDGKYTFNAADVGITVLVTYSYVPMDVEQACWELVGQRYSVQSRIGIKSKTLGGQETIVYDTSTMSDSVKDALQQYVRVSPS